jgi:hypothetical protein
MIELAPTSKYTMTYDEAWLYCATLTHSNKYDWRMPTIQDMDIDTEGWLLNDEEVYYSWPMVVTPVRDTDD